MEWRPPLLCAYPLGHHVLATLKKCEKCRKGLVETHARCARGAQRGARGAYISLLVSSPKPLPRAFAMNIHGLAKALEIRWCWNEILGWVGWSGVPWTLGLQFIPLQTHANVDQLDSGIAVHSTDMQSPFQGHQTNETGPPPQKGVKCGTKTAKIKKLASFVKKQVRKNEFRRQNFVEKMGFSSSGCSCKNCAKIKFKTPKAKISIP